MSNPIDIDSNIKAIISEAYNSRQSKLEKQHKIVAQLSKLNEPARKKLIQLIHSFGVDIKKLESIAEDNTAALKNFLQEIRPGLVEGKERKTESKWHRYNDALSPNLIKLYATVVNRAPDGSKILYLSDSDTLKLKTYVMGAGCGCEPLAYSDFSFDDGSFVYRFTPSKRGIHTFRILIDFSGFYIIKPANYPWNNDNASLQMNLEISGYQYFGHGRSNFTIINLDSRSKQLLNTYFNFDQTTWFEYQTVFKEGDEAEFFIDISLQSYAKGGGAYSEINFAEGNANYIKAIMATVKTD